ncbi:MAG: porin family protein [Desulfomonilia bacterium]
MKRMLCAITLALILTVNQTANAQEWWIGLRGGPSIPHLSGGGNEVSSGYSSILAANFGVVAEHFFTNNISVQFEVDYSGQGGERDGLQPITQSPAGLPSMPPGQYLYADFKDKSILDYLEIPVMGKYQFNVSKHWFCFTEAGPYVGLLLSAKEKTSGTSLIYVDKNRTPLTIEGQPLPPSSFDADTNVKGDLNKVNAGIMAGGGVGYMINNYSQIFIDIRGEYGLRSVQKDTAQDGRSNTGCAVFSVGYKYKIGS